MIFWFAQITKEKKNLYFLFLHIFPRRLTRNSENKCISLLFRAYPYKQSHLKIRHLGEDAKIEQLSHDVL